MATSQVMPRANGTMNEARALFELKELRKIVELKDLIFSGQHAKFKVPSSMVHKASTANDVSIQPSLKSASSVTGTKDVFYGSNAAHDAGSEEMMSHSITDATTTPVSAHNQKNSLPLTKSVDMTRMYQLRRQHIEDSLKEQAEKEKNKAKPAVETSDLIPEYDVAEVFAKAQHHVNTGTEIVVTQPVGHVDVPSVDSRSLSDSFDENTFYSSQPASSAHSVESSTVAQNHEQAPIKGQVTAANTNGITPSVENRSEVKTTEDVPMQGSRSPGEIRKSDSPVLVPSSTHPVSPPSHVASHTSAKIVASDTPKRRNQILAQYGKDFVDITHSDSEVEEVPNPSDVQRRVSVSVQQSRGLQADTNTRVLKNTVNELTNDAFPPEPAVLTELNPLLVTPATRAIPSITAPVSASSSSRVVSTNAAASSSKVAPVFQDISTADDTPKQSAKKDKKKKNKKDKKELRPTRKAKPAKGKGKEKESANISPAMPYIKPEPFSPSPNAVAPLPRPHKRRRQNYGSNAVELNYDEPQPGPARNEQPNRPHHQRERARPNYLANRADERMYEEVDSPYSNARRPARIDTQVYNPAPVDYRPIEYRQPQPANAYSAHPPGSEVRPGRATSVMVVDDSPHGGSRYYPEHAARHPVRSALDRERSRSPVIYVDERAPVVMAPPPRQRRIVVDEYGQQFYAPEPAPVRIVSRQSMAPPAYRDDGVLYESPLRPVPRPVEETYVERDGVLYRRVSPALAGSMPPPRRVVTQPAYEVDHRVYREREYSARPMGPPSDTFARPLETVARRQMSVFEGAPAPRYVDYRGSSVRPESRMSVAPQGDYMPPSTPVHGRAEAMYGGPRYPGPSVRRVTQGQYEDQRNMY